MHCPATLEELQDIIRSSERVRISAGGTKTALSASAEVSVSSLSGVLEYEPTEYTFTALAGTPLRVIRDELARNGQFLPFDPPFVEAGGTLGGTVAAGLSGPGRFRYGGLREFILGVKFVSGTGDVVFGGGKVVKNAAGFDIPKLMVGSLGRYGVMVELTFKVFPQPETATTLRADFPDEAAACAAMTRVLMSQSECMCLDLEPSSRLWIRIAGLADAQAARTAQVKTLLSGATTIEILHGDGEQQIWSNAREFRWVPPAHSLIKVPLSPAQIPLATSQLNRLGVPVPHRFSVGGNLLWLAWPESLRSSDLAAVCRRLNRQPLSLTGLREDIIGEPDVSPFEKRLLTVFDPSSRFQPSPALRS